MTAMRPRDDDTDTVQPIKAHAKPRRGGDPGNSGKVKRLRTSATAKWKNGRR